MSRIPNEVQRHRRAPIAQGRDQVQVWFVPAEGRGRAVDDEPGRSRAGHPARMTAAGDGLEHEITPDELSAGRAPGRYRALCGAVITPAALTVPAGVPCRACAVESAPVPHLAEQDARRSRREAASWLRGLRARTARLATLPARPAGGLDAAA